MSPLINSLKANINLAILALLLIGILGLISSLPDLLYVVFPQDIFLVIHSLVESAGITIGLCVFLVVWYGWPKNQNGRDLFIALTFLAVGIIDMAHVLSYEGMPDFLTLNSENKASLFWIIGRLLASGGLLFAIFIPSRTKPQFFHRLYFTSIVMVVVVTLIGAVLLFEPYLTPVYAPGEGQTAAKITLEYLAMFMNLVSIYAYGRRNPSQQHVYFLRISLVFSLMSGAAFTLYSNAYDIYNVMGHLYKTAAYYFVLRSLLETSILRPYMRISRLARALRNLAIQNIELYKEAKESERHLQQAFIQLGSVLAAKNDLDEMLQKVVAATSTVFRCDHVYLGLSEGNPPVLKLKAYVSSFKPPAKLNLTQSFMGKVFCEKKPTIVSNITFYPEIIIDDLEQAGLKSMVGAPIRHNGDVIGVLEVFSRKERDFTQHDAQFLSVFSHHAGEAIKNVRAYETTVESFAELKLLYDIVKDIANQLSPAGLLTKVSEKLSDLFKADGAVAFIMHRRDDGLHTEPVFTKGFDVREINHLQRIFSDGKNAWPWGGISAIDGYDEHNHGLITMSVLLARRMNILPLLAGGNLVGLIVFGWNDPVMEIPQGMEMMVGTIAGQTAIGLERAYLYENVQAMALTDPLTKLSNRRHFEARLNEEISRAKNNCSPISLILLDIDFFKKVNDTWGHLAGDAVLQQMGILLKEKFKITDIPARYGGEEFAVILSETGGEEAAALAEEFRNHVAKTCFPYDSEKIFITISLGVATIGSCSSGKDDGTDLVEAADRALYQAKQSGRNRAIIGNCRG
ncbi:MAG TPA: MASE3 domain-containing protein [Methylomusa anaerophila]|uniref:Response regulator PleD n=1 Tax=Methylomusa anaerophila TaxID=1930071 RepID=A0A348AGP4_9FIRM|nr:MASE3 domain-containing protein [Methylomusa anaerophila]BBB90242.1 response regulator PleD [Methylomusa anaerophila]HML89411.1 MASE3 domain-containing protein [Methylomusa anaerophila]